MHVVNCIATFNSQFIEKYEIPPVKGKNGGHGGLGGKGGYGGNSGKVMFLSQVKVIKENGISGQNGIPGKPGYGSPGIHGYEGTWFSEKVFPITQGTEFDKPEEQKSDFDSVISNTSMGSAIGATTGLVVNNVAGEFVENALISMVAKESGKRVVKQVSKEAIEQAIISSAKIGSNKIIKNMTVVVGE